MSSSTILAEVTQYIRQNDLNISQFAKKLEINVGTVSYLINGNRTLTVDHLDRMTEVLGLPKGHFYERYIKEYLQDINPDWRRIGPFLHKCATLGKLDCVRQIVNLLLDDLMYSTPLFELAEELFKNGNFEAAEILYENVAMSEKKQYSERLALCQYRLFKIRIGEDQARNLKYAHQFEPFVDRLDEVLQLDALKDLANLYRALQEWDRVETLAKEMEHKAKIIYYSDKRSDREFQEIQSKLSRPLFVYIAYAKLLCADASDSRYDYEGALQYTYEYADLSWVKETDPDTKHWLDLFTKWSQANIYVNKLLGGDIGVLTEYVEYLHQHPEEILQGILNVLFAANRYQLDVDHILQQFSLEIEAYENQSKDFYLYQVIPDHYDKFLYEFSNYYVRKKDYSNAFNYIIPGLKNSVSINNEGSIIKFMLLFEQARHMATEETCLQYRNIISEVRC
ncbi:helix-turn-helix domain-containing protein [Paenibacillus faecis]|uniref:Helix-turn-helix domain-containing protein n=1 Tax=Paenibacillus faecis TaxID=862114 RepID=A0A5D0CLE2_9BACL|nr:helix-turn-helix domain-containing protein [Paenibacillus faecis]